MHILKSILYPVKILYLVISILVKSVQRAGLAGLFKMVLWGLEHLLDQQGNCLTKITTLSWFKWYFKKGVVQNVSQMCSGWVADSVFLYIVCFILKSNKKNLDPEAKPVENH